MKWPEVPSRLLRTDSGEIPPMSAAAIMLPELIPTKTSKSFTPKPSR